MSGEALYERYKDALKRGHVASLRGRLDEALTAYAEAAEIAPERSTPHTSAGTALMRRKRPADALRHYQAAVALAPGDEAALLGRAQALVALGRRADAADAFDALAEARVRSGHLADAVDAARRGLELAEGRERRRTLERLIGQLRETGAGEPDRVALEQALLVLESAAVTRAAPGGASSAETGGVEALPPQEAAASAAAAVSADEAASAAADTIVTAERADDGGTDGEPEVEAEAVPAVVRAALDRDLPDDLDIEALSREADDGVAARDPAALGLLLDLAAAHRRDGRFDAALDACYVALWLPPDRGGRPPGAAPPCAAPRGGPAPRPHA